MPRHPRPVPLFTRAAVCSGTFSSRALSVPGDDPCHTNPETVLSGSHAGRVGEVVWEGTPQYAAHALAGTGEALELSGFRRRVEEGQVTLEFGQELAVPQTLGTPFQAANTPFLTARIGPYGDAAGMLMHAATWAHEDLGWSGQRPVRITRLVPEMRRLLLAITLWERAMDPDGWTLVEAEFRSGAAGTQVQRAAREDAARQAWNALGLTPAGAAAGMADRRGRRAVWVCGVGNGAPIDLEFYEKALLDAPQGRSRITLLAANAPRLNVTRAGGLLAIRVSEKHWLGEAILVGAPVLQARLDKDEGLDPAGPGAWEAGQEARILRLCALMREEAGNAGPQGGAR